MLYPYMTLSDETEILHSQLIQDGAKSTVFVHFERPTEEGFDEARCELPEYRWLYHKGYSDEDLRFFEELLRNNAHLIYRYAMSGGLHVA